MIVYHGEYNLSNDKSGETIMEDTERLALEYLPKDIKKSVLSQLNDNSMLCGVCMRQGGLLSLILGNKNVICDARVTKSCIDSTLDKLCKGSLYAYEEEIRNGVITTEHGIRVGVCGSAIVSDGIVKGVRDITSLSFRIPHRISGSADFLYPYVRNQSSILIYSRPALGKTTILRELIPYIGKKYRVSVIDTRHELAVFLSSGMCDIYSGYPRYAGIVSAVKTMSPEYIVCDEISTERDADAIMLAHSAGVAVIATAHADTVEQLKKNTAIKALLDSSVFNLLCGLQGFDSPPNLQQI